SGVLGPRDYEFNLYTSTVVGNLVTPANPEVSTTFSFLLTPLQVTTPEPTTFLFSGCGLLTLVFLRLRRRGLLGAVKKFNERGLKPNAIRFFLRLHRGLITLWMNLNRAVFPSSPRRGGRDTKKISRSHLRWSGRGGEQVQIACRIYTTPSAR